MQTYLKSLLDYTLMLSSSSSTENSDSTALLMMGTVLGFTFLFMFFLVEYREKYKVKTREREKLKIYKIIIYPTVIISSVFIILFVKNEFALYLTLTILSNVSALTILSSYIYYLEFYVFKPKKIVYNKKNPYNSGKYKRTYPDFERLTCFQNVIDDYYETQDDYLNALDKLKEDNEEFLKTVKIPNLYKKFADKYSEQRSYLEREETYFYYGDGKYDYFEITDVDSYEDLIERNDCYLNCNEVSMQYYKMLLFSTGEGGHSWFALNYKFSDTNPSVIFFEEDGDFTCYEVAPTLKDFMAGLTKCRDEQE